MDEMGRILDDVTDCLETITRCKHMTRGVSRQQMNIEMQKLLDAVEEGTKLIMDRLECRLKFCKKKELFELRDAIGHVFHPESPSFEMLHGMVEEEIKWREQEARHNRLRAETRRILLDAVDKKKQEDEARAEELRQLCKDQGFSDPFEVD